MRLDDIEIHVTRPDRSYRVIGPLEVRTEASRGFAPRPPIEAADSKLRRAALDLGANAVIEVEYSYGKVLRTTHAKGIAVVLDTLERPCPSCAELIKSAATRCRFCGQDLDGASIS